MNTIVSRIAERVLSLKSLDYYQDSKCMMIVGRLARVCLEYESALSGIERMRPIDTRSAPSIAARAREMAEEIACGDGEVLTHDDIEGKTLMYASDKVPSFVENPEQREALRDIIAQAWLDGRSDIGVKLEESIG